MPINKGKWYPLLIVGGVLLMNGVVFLAMSLSLPENHLAGVALGCTVAGAALFVVGFVLAVKARRGELENS